MQYIFVDTNFFMQYKEYKTIDWSILFSDDIHIIIPRQVLTELDNHKNNNNARKRNRARAIVPLLRKLRQSPITSVIGQKNVSISIIKRSENDSPRAFLDLQKPDDCIANEVLGWAELNPEASYFVLSGDVGLLTTCDDCHIPCKELPESWLLPPEPDERERKIVELENKIKILNDTRPKLNIKMDNELFNITIKQFKTPNEQTIQSIITDLCGIFPKKENFSEELATDIDGLRFDKLLNMSSITSLNTKNTQEIKPTQNDINTYHQEYDSWIAKFKSVLELSKNKFKNAILQFDVEFELINDGNGPAGDVIIQIQAIGGLLLLPPEEAHETSSWGRESLDFPQRPTPPKRKYIDLHPVAKQFGLGNNIIPRIPSLRQPEPPREPDVFYWEPAYPNLPTTTWKFSCVEFRHKLNPEPFVLPLIVPESGVSRDLRVEITIYARQLPSPIRKTIRIVPHFVQEDISERICEEVTSFINKSPA